MDTIHGQRTHILDDVKSMGKVLGLVLDDADMMNRKILDGVGPFRDVHHDVVVQRKQLVSNHCLL